MKALKNLGFLKYRHKAEEAAAALPALIAAAEKAAASVLTGGHTQRKPGPGEKFWQFREYDPSDRPQDIDWRQSAKGDRLFVREKEWQTTQTALVWCQNDADMAYRSQQSLPAKADVGTVMALALGILLARAGEQIAPLEGSGMPGRSEAAVTRLGQALLEGKSGRMPGAAMRKIPRNCGLVLVGDFLAPIEQISRKFEALAAVSGNGIVLQVLDPAELTLPFGGRVIFTSGGESEKYPVDNVETIRAAYRERIEQHIGDVKALCRRRGWHWVLHRTDAKLRETLFQAWTMMAPQTYHRGGGGA